MLGLRYRKSERAMKKIIVIMVGFIMVMTGSTACSSPSVQPHTQGVKTQSIDRHHIKRLDTAVKKYGKNHRYVRYDGQRSIRLSNGRLYPEAFKQDKFFLHGRKIDIGWDPYNRHSFKYRVLAIYNCNLSNKHHDTLLFCFHQGKPIVLIDRGQESTHVDLVESNDKGLNSEFVGIMNGFNK